jgi:hypothetical protein
LTAGQPSRAFAHGFLVQHKPQLAGEVRADYRDARLDSRWFASAANQQITAVHITWLG